MGGDTGDCQRGNIVTAADTVQYPGVCGQKRRITLLSCLFDKTVFLVSTLFRACVLTLYLFNT